MILMNDLKADTSDRRPLLKIDGVCKAFGGIQALYDVSFEVPRGNIHAVIGPNGAGKTTLFNIITGVYAPDSGAVIYAGRAVQGAKVHELVKQGIARTFQNVEMFESMTVLENVMVGRHSRTRCGFWGAIWRWPWVRKEEDRSLQKAMDLLGFVGLKDLAHTPSSDLPFGWQRFLEIARALAAEPKLLLLDEPASGLNAVETERLAQLLLQIRDRGVTLLLVEHDMSLTMEVSDRIVVLNQGKKLSEGAPREIQADEAVISAYLGRE